MDIMTLAIAKNHTDKSILKLYETLPKMSIEVVPVLPTENINTKVIYLVPVNDPYENNLYSEYIYANEKWELLGVQQKLELDEYAKKNNTIIYDSISMGRVADSEVGENSVALGNNIIAQTINSTAIGSGTIAGTKGYYITSLFNYDGTDKIYIGLSEQQVQEAPPVDRRDNYNTSNIEEAVLNSSFTSVEVGSEIYIIVPNNHYPFCGTVWEIDDRGSLIVENFKLLDQGTGNIDKIFNLEDLIKLWINKGVLEENDKGITFQELKDMGLIDEYDYMVCIPSNPTWGVKPMTTTGFAEGIESYAVGFGTHAEGAQTIAVSSYSHAEGYRTKAGYAAHSEGQNTRAKGRYSHTEGQNTEATGHTAHAEGGSTEAIGNRSHAEGYLSKAGGNAAHAEGTNTQANADSSHSEGWDTVANNVSAHAEGRETHAEGGASHAEGYRTYATKSNAHAEGSLSQANGESSHAEGNNTLASESYSHAEGNTTKATAPSSHAEGDNTEATNLYAHAEGISTKSNGRASHSEGANTVAQDNFTHAEGQQTIAKGATSHTEGYRNTTLGNSAHAEGSSNVQAPSEFTTATPIADIISDYESKAGSEKYSLARGHNSHVEGNNNLALATNSHAEGGLNIASGYASHVEGEETKATADFAHAEGKGTIASSTSQHVQGKYNIEDKNGKYAHIVGNGTSKTSRSNSHTVDWEGNAWYKGEVYVGGTEQSKGTKLAKTTEIPTKVSQLSNDSNFVNTIQLNNVIDRIDDIPVSKGSGNYSVKEGYETVSNSNYSHAEGYKTNAYEFGNSTPEELYHASHAEGYQTSTYGAGSHAEGYSDNEAPCLEPNKGLGDYLWNGELSGMDYYSKPYLLAHGTGSHAEGKNTLAFGDYSHAEGEASKTGDNAQGAHAEGYETNAVGKYSHTEGYETKADGEASHVEGKLTYAKDIASHAEGLKTSAYSEASHIEGKSSNEVSYSEIKDLSNDALITRHKKAPYFSLAKGIASHVEGLDNLTLGGASHAEGHVTQAVGYASHSEGELTQAGGKYSHAEGLNTIASADCSHAEGWKAQALKGNAHAEGGETKAYAESSHAEGYLSEAHGNFSHAEGYGTYADAEAQHVEGKFNEILGADYLHIVGNGTSASARSNAHTLDKYGNAWFAKDVFVGNTNQSDGDKLARVKELPTKTSQLTNDNNFATQEFVEQEIANFDFVKIVTELPETGLINRTYLVAKSESGDTDLYDEYLWVNDDWEFVGTKTIEVDLTDYAKVSDVPTKTSELTNDSSFVTSTDLDEAISEVETIKGEDGIGITKSEIDEDGNLVITYSNGTIIIVGKVVGENGKDGTNGTDGISITKSEINENGELVITYSNNTTTNLGVVVGKDGVTTIDGIAVKAGSGENSVVIGDSSQANGNKSLAEGNLTVAEGFASHSEGEESKALGNYAHAEGYRTTAVTDHSHAEGYDTIAGCITETNYAHKVTHAEGSLTYAAAINSHAEGGGSNKYPLDKDPHTANGAELIAAHNEIPYSLARGYQSHIEGMNTVTLDSNSHAGGSHTIAYGINQHVTGIANEIPNIIDGDTTEAVENREKYLVIVGNGTVENGKVINRANAYTLDRSGQGWFANGTSATGADYAEYFEWQDGNLNNEDRIGLIVTLDGEMIKLANNGDEILGIVSATPAVLGDNYESEWNGKYLTDKFGRLIYEDVEEFEDVITDIDEQGNPIIEKRFLGIVKRRRLNPNYDASLSYINRANRPEWDAIGMIGKLYVLDDGSCEVNKYATIGENGVATLSVEKTNMRVLSRVDENTIRVLLK